MYLLCFIEYIILLYTFLVISFAQCKEYIICLISLSTFPYALPTFTCASVIGNLYMICLGLNILRCEWSETLAARANLFEFLFYDFFYI